MILNICKRKHVRQTFITSKFVTSFLYCTFFMGNIFAITTSHIIFRVIIFLLQILHLQIFSSFWFWCFLGITHSFHICIGLKVWNGGTIGHKNYKVYTLVFPYYFNAFITVIHWALFTYSFKSLFVYMFQKFLFV